MSAKAIDLSGQVFGRLTVIERGPMTAGGSVRWRCMCRCGQETSPKSYNLRSGITTSCGCARSTHGLYGSPTYWTWASMIGRCYRPTSKSYPRYGGVGIAVCDEWRDSFEAFVEDMGERPADKTLDRIDNELGYGPSNCRWATAEEQLANRRASVRRTDSAQPFKGVERRGNVWRARIRVSSKARSLGHYSTAEQAARAYDEAARRAFGDKACVNFPQGGERNARSVAR